MRSGRSLSTPHPSANGAYDRTADNARHQFVMNSRQRDEPLFRRCPIGVLGQLPALASPADDAMVPCQRLPMLLTTRAGAVD